MKSNITDELDFHCKYEMPHVMQLFQSLDMKMYLLLIIPICIMIIAFILFAVTARNIFKIHSKAFLSYSLILAGIYPVISCSAFMALLIPKTFYLSDTINQLCFMYGAYQFFCLCLAYVGGESNFIKTQSEVFSYRTPPCCCFFVCFKFTKMTKNKFKFIRLLVLQLPIVQSLIILTLNIVFIEDNSLLQTVTGLLIPLTGISILLAVYGFNLLVRMIAPIYPDQRVLGKYFAFQLILLFVKLQPSALQFLLANAFDVCFLPYTIPMQRNMVVQMLILVEMTLLQIWFLVLYRKNPTKETQFESVLKE